MYLVRYRKQEGEREGQRIESCISSTGDIEDVHVCKERHGEEKHARIIATNNLTKRLLLSEYYAFFCTFANKYKLL